MPEPQNQRAIT